MVWVIGLGLVPPIPPMYIGGTVDNVRDGATSLATKKKVKEEIDGYSERGLAGSWSQSRRCREQSKTENDYSLWQPPKQGQAERKRRSNSNLVFPNLF